MKVSEFEKLSFEFQIFRIQFSTFQSLKFQGFCVSNKLVQSIHSNTLKFEKLRLFVKRLDITFQNLAYKILKKITKNLWLSEIAINEFKETEFQENYFKSLEFASLNFRKTKRWKNILKLWNLKNDSQNWEEKKKQTKPSQIKLNFTSKQFNLADIVPFILKKK